MEDTITPSANPGYLRIATEEAFAPPELMQEWNRLLDEGHEDIGFMSLHGHYQKSQSPHRSGGYASIW